MKRVERSGGKEQDNEKGGAKMKMKRRKRMRNGRRREDRGEEKEYEEREDEENEKMGEVEKRNMKREGRGRCYS